MNNGILLKDPTEIEKELDFQDERDDHQIKKWFKSAKGWQLFAAGGFAIFSALFTFAFGMTWFSPSFFEYTSWMGDQWGIVAAKILSGSFLFFIYDFAAWVSIRTLIFGAAQTRTQQDTIESVLSVSFWGSAITTVVQVALTLDGGLISLSLVWEQIIGWTIVLITLSVFVFDLYQMKEFYNASPEVMESKHKAEQREKALKLKQKRQKEQAQLQQEIIEAEHNAQMAIIKQAHGMTEKKRAESAKRLSSILSQRQYTNAMNRMSFGETQDPQPQILPQTTETEGEILAAVSPDNSHIEIIPIPPQEETTPAENFPPAPQK